jgi:DNA-binding ferritin-like protein (Dps family)
MSKRERVWKKFLNNAGDMPAELKENMKDLIFNVWSDAKIESLLK